MTDEDALPNYVLVCLSCHPRGAPTRPLGYHGIGMCNVCGLPVYGSDQPSPNYVWSARANLPEPSPNTEKRFIETSGHDVVFDDAEKNKDKA